MPILYDVTLSLYVYEHAFGKCPRRMPSANKAGMRSTDMLFIRNIIQPVQNSTDPHATVDACLITDRWSSGPFEPRLDTAQGGREDWTLLLQSFTRVPGGSTDVTGEGYAGSTLDGNSTTLVAECIVQRKLDTGDTATDHPIHNTTLALAVAYGDIEAGILQRHRKGTIQAMEVNFFEGFTVERNTGGRGGDGSESGQRLRSLLFWHGALLTVAWYVWCVLLLLLLSV